MTCFSVLFSSLTLPFPGAYLVRALHGCQLRYTKWCDHIVWRRLKLRKPGGTVSVCLSNSEAVTTSLTFTIHSCSHLVASLSLSRCLSQAHLFLTSSRDTTVTPHMLSLQRRPVSQTLTSTCTNFFGLQGTSCQYSGYLLPPRMHHRKLQSGTQPSGTTREESAARLQLPSFLYSFLLAISKKPLRSFFGVWINKWKLWLMALRSTA